jgi:hypothetical protein
MTKNMKVVIGIILALALVILVALVSGSLLGNDEATVDQEAGEGGAEINSFTVNDGNFEIVGSGFMTAEVYGMITNVNTPRLIGSSSSPLNTADGSTWLVPVPDSPLLIEELYAVGLDQDGVEIVRKAFSAVGVPEIYGTLYLDVPIEYVELSVGETVTFENASITLEEIINDVLCNREDCRDGRDAELQITVVTDDTEESNVISTTDVGESIAGYYISVTDITPGPGEVDEDSYVVTIAVSKDIKG